MTLGRRQKKLRIATKKQVWGMPRIGMRMILPRRVPSEAPRRSIP